MEGTALSERDLQRSRAESASAVFLLADRFSPNYQQEDLNVQFQVPNRMLIEHCLTDVQRPVSQYFLLHTPAAEHKASLRTGCSCVEKYTAQGMCWFCIRSAEGSES